LRVLKLFTAASGLSDAHASPAPNLPGDSWLLVVTAGVTSAGFSRGKPLRIHGMQFVPRTPVNFLTGGFPDGSMPFPRCRLCLPRASGV
jgi:hypothetical protein